MRTRVVICGSFRRDPVGLKLLFTELEATGCRILSPLSLDFTNRNDAFVTTSNEHGFTPNELERFHLRAMRDADIVWLYAPGGYVGTSAAYELGFAAALEKKVFTCTTPTDSMLASQILVVTSVFAALQQAGLLHD